MKAVFSAVVLLTLLDASAAPVLYTEDQAKAFFDGYGAAMQKTNLFSAYKKDLEKRKLSGPPYNPLDMKNFLEPKPKYYSYGGSHSLRKPRGPWGAMTWEQANAALLGKTRAIEAEEAENETPRPADRPKDLMVVLEERRGKQPWYHPSEVKSVLTYGFGRVPYVPDPPNQYKEGFFPSGNFIDLLKNIKLRASWNDLLVAENQDDPNVPGKKAEDLVGATFSYAYNAEVPSTTWTAKGTVLYPIGWRGLTDNVWLPAVYAFVPSFSINKVGGQNVPSDKQVDQVVFRGATYIEWDGISQTVENIQLRAAPLFVTTTEMEAALPGYEIEIEPQLTFYANDNPLLNVGYQQVLIPKATTLEDRSDDFLLRMNLRFWGHLEGGDVRKTSTDWAVTHGGFMRAGPMAQLRLESPGFVYFKTASITATLAYLPTIYGKSDNDWYFDLSGALALYEEKSTGRRLSLVGQYTDGSLLLTGQTVNLFTLGIGIVY